MVAEPDLAIPTLEHRHNTVASTFCIHITSFW